MEFHFDEKFWLAIAFFAFLGLMIKYISPIIIKMLDDKSKSIAKELLEAKEMKEKAAKLLEAAEKYHKESESYASRLIEDAQKEAEKFLSDAEKSIAKELEKKTAAAQTRIKFAEERALKDIKESIIASAIEEIEKEAQSGLDKNKSDYILQKAMENFEKA